MEFYRNMQINCINPDNFYPWPSREEMYCAELISRHVALTSPQLREFGYPPKKMGKMVKKGIVHRYEVFSPEDRLPSIYTVGNSANLIAKLPIPRFPNIEILRNLLLVNQVIVSILNKTDAEINVNPKRPIQIIKINNKLGIFVAKDRNYISLPLRYDITQSIVILPNDSMAIPDCPFRYVLENEIEYNSFDINFYNQNGTGLVPVQISFTKNDPENTCIAIAGNNFEKERSKTKIC